MNSIKEKLLHFPLTRELLFFLFQKKVYKKTVDKKIRKLLYGKIKQSDKRIDHLIVSLTSFPGRIEDLQYTLFSILVQTVLPEKVVLWLADEQFPQKEADLPPVLIQFKHFGLEIRWCENISSYKKLIPTLESYSDYFIVTADDDLYYPKRWLEKLWQEHLKRPDEVVCHIANRIRFDEHNKPMPYTKWEFNTKKGTSFLNFTLSGGGVLWHKNYFHRDIAKTDLFMKFAPTADDIWFYFMVILNEKQIRVVKHPCNKAKYVNPYREYNIEKSYKLATINVEENHNDIQFRNVVEYYNVDFSDLL
jgi:hypothetical protein